MDSPKREPCFSPCDLQGSPLFKFLCSLSPIKQAKTGHVAQTYSELSFPAPLPVFVSPRAREKREAGGSSTTNGGGSEEPPRRVVTHDALLRLANCAHSLEEAVARQSSPVEQPKPTSLPRACSDLSFHPAPPPPPPETTEECEESVDEVPPEPVITQEDLNTTACAQTVEELQRPAVTQESLFKSTICVRIVEEVQAVCTQEVIQTTRCEGQPVGTQEGVMKSATCVRSLTFGIQQALEECVPFDMDLLVTPERRRLSLQSDSMDGEKSRTPKKKRKSVSSADGCKRCHCKKSKCLKLYCECFAAGVYCLDSCACRDCFNKPEFSETVLGTRQQIETRNPLAFAPKIVQTSEPCPAATEGITCPDTLASARHKRGCNCKKSMCLKKYCECYQAGVGCSDGCRCNGCKNIYGMKKAQEDPDQTEDPSSITITSISPITPTFPHPPGLLDSAEFRRIYESASSTVVQSCTPEGSTEQPSPRWEGLEDICTITPLAQRPPLPTSSLLVKSEPPQSPFSKPSESPSYPTSSHSCFLPSDLTSTPPSPPPTTAVGKLMDPSCQLASDESPEFLREDRSPRTILKGSPKQKRVVPPNTSEFINAPSSVSRGRKLTLQTLPSLPPVTPFSFSQQGYRRS